MLFLMLSYFSADIKNASLNLISDAFLFYTRIASVQERLMHPNILPRKGFNTHIASVQEPEHKQHMQEFAEVSIPI